MLINLPTVSALAHSQCAGDRLISRIIHSNASVKYYMRRPDLASLLGRSVLIASFEKDKDGKQRYWEVLAAACRACRELVGPANRSVQCLHCDR
jgi:hypothetical protein